MTVRFASLLLNATRRFAADRRGSFATALGLSVMAATMCAGIALDYTRMIHTRTVVDDALDAAILSAAHDLAEGGKPRGVLNSEFQDMFFANIENRGLQAESVELVSFDADAKAGTVNATAKATVKLAFMGLVGKDSVDIGSGAEARFSSDAIEIAMVLDVTGSMNGAKLEALKKAATDAVDILVPADTSGDKVRIGLVPYARSVNAGRYAYRATARVSNRCVTERDGPLRNTDISYTMLPAGADSRVLDDWNDCPSQEILPLTADRRDLQKAIGGLRADGSTAGHIGIAWGYYLLSPNWRSLWSRAAEPAAYGDPVQKIVVLMTDGIFNTYYRTTGGDDDAYPYPDESAADAEALCDDMKKAKADSPGIIVYSIAFRAPKDAAKLLRTCASNDTADQVHFYSAESETELRDAFRSIALGIQKLRLTK